MKKFFYLFITCTTVFFSYSQEGQDSQERQDFDLNNYIKIPNSPEATAFLKYGSTPVNLFRGVPDINIPIHEISSGNITMPISLSYDASGIQVSQISTWIGLGWNLNSGGVISRRVMGVPDNVLDIYGPYSPESREFMEYIRHNPMGENSLHDSPEDILPYFHWIDKLNNRKADFQPDLFSFSVNDLSGTIFIDLETRKAKCIENPNLKITLFGVENDINGWEITDENGIKYTFYETENTFNFFSGSTSEIFGESKTLEYNNFYVSSWKLTRITDLTTNKIVNFIYTADKTWHENEILSTEGSRSNTPVASGPCKKKETINGIDVNEYKIQSSYLKSIQYDGNHIDFILRDEERLDFHGKKSLEKIEIYNGHKKINEVRLFNESYFGDIRGYNSKNSDQTYLRLKLDSLAFKNTFKKYKFDYFQPSNMPTRASKSVDFWGFFNNKPNRTLVPKQVVDNGFNTILSGADRNPVLASTKVGTLTKIYYPTGGFTVFDYDLNKLSSTFEEVAKKVVDVEVKLDNNSPDYANYCDDNPSNPWYESGAFRIGSTDENVIVELDIKYLGNTIQHSGNEAQFFVVYKMDGYGTLDYCQELYAGHPSIVGGGSFNVNEHSGNVSLLLSGTRFNPDGTIDQGTSKYSSGKYGFYLFNNNPNVKMRLTKGKTEYNTVENKNYIGGLRVLKVSDYESENNIALQKGYIYNDVSIDQNLRLDDLKAYRNTSGVQHRVLDFFGSQSSEIYDRNFGPATCSSYMRYAQNRSTASQYDIAYSTVTEVIFSDSIFNGVTVYDFYNESEGKNKVPFVKTKILNGKIKMKRTYNDVYDLESSIRYNYSKHGSDFLTYGASLDSGNRSVRRQRVIRESIGNKFYYVYKKYLPCCITREPYMMFGDNIPDYKFQYYTASSLWARLDNVETITYFNEAPIATKTTYEYGDKHFFPLVEKNDIGGGKTIITETQYPKDILTPTLAEQKLITKNRLATPIQVQKTVEDLDGNILSKTTQHTNYKKWTESLVLPDSIKASKGNDILETKVVFHDYYSNGNIKEISKKDGAHIYYIWGYYTGNQPIAKIENFSKSDITLAISTAINTAVLASNFDIDNCRLASCSEQKLRNALMALQDAIPNTSIMSSYTYDPFIGLTSMTDPSGSTTYYYYDEFNRLSHISDDEDFVLKKYNYNYQGNKLEEHGVLSASLAFSSTALLANTSAIATAQVTDGSGTFTYLWKVNGQEVSEKTNRLTHLFGASGNKTVTCTVTDIVTGKKRTVTGNITVYGTLNTPILNTTTYNLTNRAVSFTTSNIGGGSGDRTYEWYIDNVKQSATRTTFSKAFIAGTYVIMVRVRDNKIEGHYKETTKTIYVYNSLNTPNLVANKTYVLKGNSISFTTSGIAGGSGHKAYEWYINNAKQSNTGTSLNKSFSTTGTYTVKFRVRDTRIPEHYKERSKTIYVYNALNTPNVNSATYNLVNRTVAFSTSGLGGGSGYRTYEWYVNGAKQSGTSTSFNKAFSTGTYTVKFRVRDARISGHYKERSKTIYVYNALNTPGLNLPQGKSGSIALNYIAGKNLSFGTSGIGSGSGHRRYEWYINGAKQSSTGTSFSRTLSKGTYKVMFRVIDTRIASHYKQVQKTIYVYNTPTVHEPILVRTYNSRRAQIVDFETTGTGGSGNYTYDWYLNYTSRPYGSHDKKVRFTIGKTGYYTIYCRAIDVKTGAISRLKSKQFYIRVSTSGSGGDQKKPTTKNQ